MVRGCALLSHQLRAENLPMAFFLEEKDHFAFMEERLLDLPVIHPQLVEGADKSLTALPVFFDRPSHIEFYKLLLEVVDALKLSSLKGMLIANCTMNTVTDISAYFQFIRIYHGIIKMDTGRIRDFIDPCNTVVRILIGHFLAIQMIVSPIIDREWAHRPRHTPIRSNLNWIKSIYQDCPTNLKYYMEWPKYIAECVEDELLGRRRTDSQASIMRKNEGYSRTYF